MRLPNSATRFSLVEVMVAMGVLVFATLATLAALSQSAQVRQSSTESEDASQILYAEMARIRTSSADMSQVVTRHGDTTFLTAITTELKDPQVLVTVLSEAECSTVFLADLDHDPLTGVNGHDLYDLDGDGTPGENDANSTRGDYTLMVPVRLTLTWTTVTNTQRTVSMHSFIYPSKT